MPRLTVLLHLVDAGTRISTGSSTVEMLRPSVVEDVERGVQRHGLAGAGGAGHQHHAVGLLDRIEKQLLLVRLVAQLVDAELGRLPSRIRSTIFSPNRVGQVLTRKSI
jgi:hypothetical protein